LKAEDSLLCSTENLKVCHRRRGSLMAGKQAGFTTRRRGEEEEEEEENLLRLLLSVSTSCCESCLAKADTGQISGLQTIRILLTLPAWA
jgi:hypothetical protein